MSKQIGLPIKADTTVFPTTTLTFLGLELDSELMEIRLPLDKLGKLKDQLNHFKFKKKATLRELRLRTNVFETDPQIQYCLHLCTSLIVQMFPIYLIRRDISIKTFHKDQPSLYI
jgi:hypothetical protein